MSRQSKYKRRIGLKIAAMICLVSLIVIIIGVGLGYFWGYRMLRDTISEKHSRMAELLATSMHRIINEEIKDIKVYLNSPFWQDVVEEYNLRYEDKDAESIQRHLLTIDNEWVNAYDDSPLINKYLGSPLSLRLRRLAESDSSVAEIFLTDREGGLVASSGRTTDFYQADENWWQETFDKGKGKDVVEDVQFDKSAGVMSITFAIPIRSDKGALIGACKTVLDIKRLLEPLRNVEIGNTGHAVLVDRNGYILFHRGLEPLQTKFVSEKDFSDILGNRRKWIIADNPHFHKAKMFVACAEMKHPLLLQKDMLWRVCIDQNAEEVFAPLRTLILQASILLPILIIIVIPLGFIFGAIFVKPIKKLHEATDRVAQGDLNYKVEVKTGDEIEQFANSFNKMTQELRESTTSIDNLNQEITERKKAEEELRESESYLRVVLSSVLTGILIIDAETHKIVDVNPLAVEMISLPKEQIVGRECFNFICPHGKGECPITDLGQPVEQLEQEFIRGNGEKIQIVKTARYIKIRGRGYIVASFLDITKRRQAEERMKEAMAVKSNFTSMVSHELRTPLSAIKEGIGIVLDGITGKINRKQKDLLQTSKRNVDRLTRLINDILDFQKLDSGMMQFDIQENDINDTVREVSKIMGKLTKQKKLSFSIELQPYLPKVRFDRDKIIQVLTNLINNAIKFTEKGGIAIKTEQGNNIIHVMVEDTGPGIRKGDLSKLFQAFQQLGAPRERKPGGTGLGLAICKEIIERHRGKIWAESEYGKGSIFHFILPIKERRG